MHTRTSPQPTLLVGLLFVGSTVEEPSKAPEPEETGSEPLQPGPRSRYVSLYRGIVYIHIILLRMHMCAYIYMYIYIYIHVHAHYIYVYVYM